MKITKQSPDFTFFNTRKLPVIIQDEGAECGLACVAMVASYWGHAIDMFGMRNRFPLSLQGTDLRGLMNIAQGIGLRTRPLQVGLERLGDMQLPCILHWDMTHFVVLKSIKRGECIIHDPSVGERRLSFEEVSPHFTGIVLEVLPGPDIAQVDQRRDFTLRQLMGPVSGLKRGVLQLVALGLALQVCVLLAPFLMQWVVDEALSVGDRDLITVLGIGFLLLVGIQSAIAALRSWVTTVLSTSLKFGWLGNTFGHLMRLPLTYFERRQVGDILSRFGSVQSIQRTLTTQFVEGVLDGLLVITTLIVMFTYSSALTAVSLSFVALYILCRVSMVGRLSAGTAEQIVHAANQETYFLESIRGVQSVKLFNRGEERRVGWLNILTRQLNAELTIAKLNISYQTANTLLFNSERVIIVWIGAMAVLDHSISMGMLFAFLSYREHFSQRMAALVDKVIDLRMLRIHAHRVADVMLTTPEDDQQQMEIAPESIRPSIELRNVSFRYSKGDPLILDKINLTIPASQFVAITGASGCGKTTLIKLILGLLQPVEGEILVGGVPVQRLGLSNYRNMVGTVMQGDALFSGTIADNISFFSPGANIDRIEHCAKLAAMHDEIMAMPMRYYSLVGDIGTGLSGGQQQRILLARAFYKDPTILILDEATSHLDVSNERAVNDSVRKNRLTRIVVAHRPETIAMANRVVVIENGTISHDSDQEPVARAKLAA